MGDFAVVDTRNANEVDEVGSPTSSECVAGRMVCAEKVDTTDSEQTFANCAAVVSDNTAISKANAANEEYDDYVPVPEWAICQYLRPCGNDTHPYLLVPGCAGDPIA